MMCAHAQPALQERAGPGGGNNAEAILLRVVQQERCLCLSVCLSVSLAASRVACLPVFHVSIAAAGHMPTVWLACACVCARICLTCVLVSRVSA